MSERVFVSYSSKDRHFAEAVTSRLRNCGIEVWIDYEQIAIGDPILSKIGEGLSNTDALLLLVSKNSGESPWCRKEYEVLLQKEIILGKTKVIPIKLDDAPLPILLSGKRYIRFSDLDNNLPDLLKAISGAGKLATGSNIKTVPSIPPNVLDGLTLLLLIDQYPIGVWGRSMADIVGAYGHAEDPGSITVSNWAANALRILQPEGRVPEIDAFSKYLLERRRKDSGAIGMRKSLGNAFAPEYTIIENRRHTAVGAIYLYKHYSALDLSLESLRYVMEARTPRGAWVAIGGTSDDNADPLTTGYVLGVLRTFERENLLNLVSVKDRELFLARYWKAGLLWLYENLLENGGWWMYKSRSASPSEKVIRRTYCYTTDILLALPEFWLEDTDYGKAHEDLMIRLLRIWRSNASGLPSGPNSTVANLEATAQFALVAWKCRTRYPAINTEVMTDFVNNLETLLFNGESDAAGWSLAISYFAEVLGDTLSPGISLEGLRELVRKIEQQVSTNEKIEELVNSLPAWVAKIITNKILPPLPDTLST
jgi:hypothetical protein